LLITSQLIIKMEEKREATEISQQVIVSFVTDLEEHRVDEAPVTLDSTITPAEISNVSSVESR
jgi:hypothetical protein